MAAATRADAVLEISGRDSVAAAFIYCEAEAPTVLLPTYVHTPTEYGDFAEIERNVEILGRELDRRFGATLLPLVEAGSPALWRALAGRFAGTVSQRFVWWTPCVGCHLYLHLMRIPIARRWAASTVVSGERERHGALVKPNQAGSALDLYAETLASVGLTLAFPIRHLTSREDVVAIAGEPWAEDGHQLSCALSGNYLSDDGSPIVGEAPDRLLDEYLRPAGLALAGVLAERGDCATTDYEGIIRTILQGGELGGGELG